MSRKKRKVSFSDRLLYLMISIIGITFISGSIIGIKLITFWTSIPSLLMGIVVIMGLVSGLVLLVFGLLKFFDLF